MSFRTFLIKSETLKKLACCVSVCDSVELTAANQRDMFMSADFCPDTVNISGYKPAP